MGYKCQATARKAQTRAVESYRCKHEATTEAQYEVMVTEGKTVDGTWVSPTYEKKMLPACEWHAADKMWHRRHITLWDIKPFGHIKDR